MKKIMFNDKYDLTQAVLDGSEDYDEKNVHNDIVSTG